MDWKRFKNIIIIALIFINIFLAATLVRMRLAEQNVSKDTRKNIISILKKSDIIIDESVFPKSKESYTACYISRFLPDDEKFISAVIGDIKERGDGKYSGDFGTLDVSDEVFSFYLNLPEKTALDEESTAALCESFMDKCGIYKELYSEKKYTRKKGTKTSKLRYELNFDGYGFFDSYIDFEIAESGIQKVIGRNIVKNETAQPYESKVMPMESVIVGVSLDKKTEKSVRITDISFGYMLGRSEGRYQSALALPIWRISFDDGDVIYYDARNGSKTEI